MPASGDNFEEHLSAYLDGELSDQELDGVQAELGRSESLRRRLGELSELRSDLRECFHESFKSNQRVGDRSRASRNSLAARVIAEAQREAVQLGLPDDHHVRLAERAEIANIAKANPLPRKYYIKLAAWTTAIAASLLLAIYLPAFFRHPSAEEERLADSSTTSRVPASETLAGDVSAPTLAAEERFEDRADESAGELSSPEPGNRTVDEPRYVSQIEFQGRMILVVDVTLANEARRQGVLEQIFRRAGLPPKEPIVGGNEIKQALRASRSIVDPERDAASSAATVYFLRGDMKSIGRVVESIFFDRQSFTQVAFDLAIDNPTANLLQAIARSTGQRFAVDETFVAPVMVGDESAEGAATVPSPFESVPEPARLVSRGARERGFDLSAAALEVDQTTSLLLLVR